MVWAMFRESVSIAMISLLIPPLTSSSLTFPAGSWASYYHHHSLMFVRSWLHDHTISLKANLYPLLDVTRSSPFVSDLPLCIAYRMSKLPSVNRYSDIDQHYIEVTFFGTEICFSISSSRCRHSGFFCRSWNFLSCLTLLKTSSTSSVETPCLMSYSICLAQLDTVLYLCNFVFRKKKRLVKCPLQNGRLPFQHVQDASPS